MSLADETALDRNPSSGDIESPSATGAGSTVRFTSNIVGPLFLFADALCLLVSAPLALAAYQLLVGEWIVPSVHLFAFVAISASYLLIRGSKRAYGRTLANDLHDEGDSIFDAVVSFLIASALVWQFGLIEDYSRGLSLLFIASLVLCIGISRPLIRVELTRRAARGLIEQRIAFYGADQRSLEFIRNLLTSLNLPHLRIVGVADDRERAKGTKELPFVGGLEDLITLARRGELDQVLISVPDIPRERLFEIVETLSEVSVGVSLIPAQAIELAPDYRVHLLGTVPVLTLWQRPFRDINHFIKRAEDLTLTIIGLILLAPVFAICALLIRLTSPGSILFVQPRLGFNNEVIGVLKFRTMYVEHSDFRAKKTTARDDPRVTPVGRVLRRLSLDELPQLYNVLKGEMSLVGPRPHALEMKVGDLYYQDAVRGYLGRHRVKPGLTGLAQVRGLRGEIRTLQRAKRRVELDKEYIDRWSIWLDLWILVATVRAVLFDRDAY